MIEKTTFAAASDSVTHAEVQWIIKLRCWVIHDGYATSWELLVMCACLLQTTEVGPDGVGTWTSGNDMLRCGGWHRMSTNYF